MSLSCNLIPLPPTPRGVWNVPHVTACYLVRSCVLGLPGIDYSSPKFDPDVAFTAFLRTKNVFLHVDNREKFGHLVSVEHFDTSHVNNEMYQVLENRLDFESRYLHEDYRKYFEPDRELLQPCPDVYWFPLFNPRFCQELIQEAEANGSWVTGAYNDPVPTQDIHMEYIGLGEMWDVMLDQYIFPLVSSVYKGYNDHPHCPHKFVVRYKSDQQASLRPHHDTATYTINLALNNAHLDYKGGGCRFIRYNCSVEDTRIGWMLMHPGRLTHYHEGLPISQGTRYILVSFVDP